MADLPDDLVTLPTAPYAERPASLPLDTEECRTAIWLARGNITEAAKLIKVTSSRLRNFISKSPYLTAEMQESVEQVVDIAEMVVVDALEDVDNPSRRDTMARFVLGSQGKRRGWGSAVASGGVNIKSNGTVIVQWADGSTFGDPNPPTGPAEGGEYHSTIEHDSNEGEAA